MEQPLYQRLASLIQAIRNCDKSGNTEWAYRHSARIRELLENEMPSGSGFDGGTLLDFDASHADKLVFTTSFHHMNEVGYYDGWTEHTVTVTPSLLHGINLRISGRNRNDIKEYIHSEFHESLMTMGK